MTAGFACGACKSKWLTRAALYSHLRSQHDDILTDVQAQAMAGYLPIDAPLERDTAMPKQDKTPEEEWDEFVPDIIEAIEEGSLDKHLKLLTRKLIERARNTGQIEESKVGDGEGKTLARNTLRQNTRNTIPVPDREGNIHQVPVLMNAIVSVAALADPKMRAKQQFEYNGLWYNKRDIVDHVLLIPHNVSHKWAGKQVHITGAGEKSFKVYPVRKDELGKHLPIGGESGFIDKKFLDAFLGGGA